MPEPLGRVQSMAGVWRIIYCSLCCAYSKYLSYSYQNRHNNSSSPGRSHPPHRGAASAVSVSSRHIAEGGNPPPGNFKSPGNFSWCKFLNVVPALLADTAVFFLKAFVKKNVAARCTFPAQNIPKCVCGRGFAPDITGEAYRAPRPLAGFQGADSRQGRGGKGREGRGGGKGRGSVPHFFFLQFNDCLAVIVRLSSSACVYLSLSPSCRLTLHFLAIPRI